MCVHEVEYYSPITNEIWSLVKEWMEFKDIVLWEISHIQKRKQPGIGGLCLLRRQ
jgi:hypothetical protein